MIWLALRLLLELIGQCHCSAWVTTAHGPRCIAPLDHPRCELVSGWHAAAFGVQVCSRSCNEPGDASSASRRDLNRVGATKPHPVHLNSIPTQTVQF